MDVSPKAPFESPFLGDPPAYPYSDLSGPSTLSSPDGAGHYSILKKEGTTLAIDPSLPVKERIQIIQKRSFEWDFGNGFPNELTDLLNKTVNKQEYADQFISLCKVFLSFKNRQLLQRGRKAPYWLWHISDELIRDLEKKSGNLSDEEVSVALKIMDCIVKKTTNTSKNIKKLKAIQTNFYKVEQIQNNALNFRTKFEEVKYFFLINHFMCSSMQRTKTTVCVHAIYS